MPGIFSPVLSESENVIGVSNPTPSLDLSGVSGAVRGTLFGPGGVLSGGNGGGQLNSKDQENAVLRPFARKILRIFNQKDERIRRGTYNSDLNNALNQLTSENPAFSREAANRVLSITGIDVSDEEFNLGEALQNQMLAYSKTPEGLIAIMKSRVPDSNGFVDNDATNKKFQEIMFADVAESHKLDAIRKRNESLKLDSERRDSLNKNDAIANQPTHVAEVQALVDGLLTDYALALKSGTPVDAVALIQKLRETRFIAGQKYDTFEAADTSGTYKASVSMKPLDDFIDLAVNNVDNIEKLVKLTINKNFLQVNDALIATTGFGAATRDPKIVGVFFDRLNAGHEEEIRKRLRGMNFTLRASPAKIFLDSIPTDTPTGAVDPSADPTVTPDTGVDFSETTDTLFDEEVLTEAKKVPASVAIDTMIGFTEYFRTVPIESLTSSVIREDVANTFAKGAAIFLTHFKGSSLSVDSMNELFNKNFTNVFNEIVKFDDITARNLKRTVALIANTNIVSRSNSIMMDVNSTNPTKGFQWMLNPDFSPDSDGFNVDLVFDKQNLIGLEPATLDFLNKHFKGDQRFISLTDILTKGRDVGERVRGINAPFFGTSEFVRLSKELKKMNQVISLFKRKFPSMAKNLDKELNSKFNLRPNTHGTKTTPVIEPSLSEAKALPNGVWIQWGDQRVQMTDKIREGLPSDG